MKKTLLIIVSTVLIMGVVYFAGVGFYSEKFSANSTFGTVDVSNLTLSEAQAKVIEDLNDKEFVLEEDGQEVARLKLGELEPEYKTESELEASYLSQDPTTWVNGFFEDKEYNQGLEEQINFSEEEIINSLSAQGLSNEEREAATDAGVDYDETEGYYVVEGSAGNQIDPSRLESAIVEGIQNENYTIDLEEAYAQPEVTEVSEEITSVMDEIESVSSVNITYEIAGEEVTIPQDEIENWIYFDSSNELIIDAESVKAYLSTLNEEYSTFYKDRTFNSTLQGEVTVPPGILGWSIDTEAEAEALINDIHVGKDVSREPIYFSSGGIAGASDDIGSTYVEIDLSNQYMFLYVDGELILETPMVSGKIGAETVPGANAVNEMLTDTDLVGYNPFSKVDYSVPVNYWIRFDDKAQGIHDASWQGSFGGNVYQSNGSLGCINTPIAAVEVIYNNVDYGTPVMVFY